MTRLWAEGEAVVVTVTAAGRPLKLVWHHHVHTVQQVVQQWVVETGWWEAVVADLLAHAVGEGGEDAAVDGERRCIDGAGLDARDGVIGPVDIALDRAIPAQDEAVVLGNTLVLVETAPDVTPLGVVLHQDVTGVRGPGVHLLLVAGETADRHFHRFEQRAHCKERRFVVLDRGVVDGKA